MNRTQIFLGLAILVMLSYAPSWRGQFLWDDKAHVQDTAEIARQYGWTSLWKAPGLTQQYYPLTLTAFLVEHHFWGNRPTGYHLVNFLLHSVNAFLVGLLLLQLSIPGAWLAAFVFAVHPMHVESVAWISELKNILSSFFFLLALLAVLRQERNWRHYLFSLILFIAALCSKTTTVAYPFIALALLAWKFPPLKAMDWTWAAICASGAAFAGLETAALERASVGALGNEWALTLPQRMLLAGRCFEFYLGKLLWPEPLMFSYPHWLVTVTSIPLWLSGFATFVFFVMLWRSRKRYGWGPLMAIGCFSLLIFPALGFFNVYPMRFSWVNDHYVYLASVPILALVCSGFISWTRQGIQRERFRFAAAGVVIAILSTATFVRSRHFRSDEELCLDTLAKNPRSSLAHTNLAAVYLADGRIRDALVHNDLAIEVDPGYAIALSNRAVCLALLGRMKEAEAGFQLLVAIHPEYPGSHFMHAQFLRSQNQWPAAQEEYEQTVELAQIQAGKSRFLLSQLQRIQNAHAWEWIAASDERQKDWLAADRAIEQALRYAPGTPALVNHQNTIRQHLQG